MGTTSDSAEPNRAQFVTTHWSVVLSASHDSAEAAKALDRLCSAYWYPIYAAVRRQGFIPADAEDLTQAFFASILKENFIASADPAKGRFRSYLLIRLKHFLADEWDRMKAQKRGGGQRLISFETEMAEKLYRLEPADLQSPDKLFEHRWAVTLLERVFERLRQEHEAEGKTALFDELKICLAQERAAVPYAQVSARLGLSEGALRVAAHRLRRRYRAVLREEIAETVSGKDEVEAELRHLLKVLAGE